jgi:DNA-binding PadR family transcriptional regulator
MSPEFHKVLRFISLLVHKLTYQKKGSFMLEKYSFRELILNILEEKELSKKEILDEIRGRSDRRISNKTLNENLMGLLKEGKIDIIDYDFQIYDGIKRIQSIKADGVVFSLVKNDIIEINFLITQLDSNEPNEVREASYKLKKLFKKKMKDTKIQEEDINKVFNKTLSFVNSQPEDQKRILTSRLALSLSNEEGSDEIFKRLMELVYA